MRTLKPGTRCECSNEECPNDTCHIFSLDDADAGITNQLDAARLVIHGDGVTGIHTSTLLGVTVPMCEPCAAFHESKVSK
jgi:hypothetical protein